MSIFSYIRKHAVITVIIVLAVIFIAIIGGRAASEKAPADNTSAVKQVSLVSAAAFRRGGTSVSADGVVESHSQADLKSQTSAPLSVINVSIGQSVYPGQVLLELQNSDIRAQLAQAQATLALSQGQFSTGAVSLDSAKQNAIDKLRDAYNKTYEAVITQADTVLYNNDGNGGRLTSYTVETSLYTEITSTDLDLHQGLQDWRKAVDALSTRTASTSVDDIKAAIKIAETNMSRANVLFGDMSRILNNLAIYATPSFMASVNAWKATVSGAQASVSGAEQSLTGAETGLNASVSSQGGTAPAQISLAQAGVSNLEAQLAKTIVKSPISGKVSALPLREGELASPGTLLATVIGNDSGLEIKAYVSGEDLSRVAVGAPVMIQGRSVQNGTSTADAIRGIVSNIAPGVDSTTRKAEVDIDITNGANSGLVIGRTVTVFITTTKASMSGNHPVSYLLPIQDVKIIPGAAYVYTVDPDSKIKRNDVTLGQIQGDFIEVISGLDDTMNIVSPVYELDEGQLVKVQ